MQNKKEIWKDIIGYENIYQVSNLGNIKSLDRIVKYSNGKIYKYKGKLRNPSISEYRLIALSKNNKVSMVKISRLVAIHFIKKDNKRNIVNHKDHNKLNDCVDNLEWVNHSENSLHSSNRHNKLRGIFYDKKRERWASYIYRNNKNIFVGRFHTKEEAIEKQKEKLKEYDYSKYNSIKH